ncbi:MAG: hormogonium polysaccharide biosynthesis glycosyltransferase HpsE [Cyanobacteria bacterium J06626_4]
MLDFCVAIRAYNAERYLPEILDALFSQKNLEDTQWEVLIVDNCSTDRTAEIVREYEAKWLTNVPIRYCFEPRQGSSYARRRAIEEANAPLIGFLDDDNEPELNWINKALEFSEKHPDAAAFGSQIHGKFEAEPPEGFQRIAGFIPVVERKTSVCFTEGKYDRLNMMPPGAGLVIRRQSWLDVVPEDLVLKGPVGKSLGKKGEDIEALMYLKRAGWEIWFNSEMHIYHHIPKTRFEREYLLRFFKGTGLSRFYTRALSCPKWKVPFKTFAYMINDLRKVMLHVIKHGRQSRRDLITECEFQLLLHSFLSPFHALFSSQE